MPPSPTAKRRKQYLQQQIAANDDDGHHHRQPRQQQHHYDNSAAVVPPSSQQPARGRGRGRRRGSRGGGGGVAGTGQILRQPNGLVTTTTTSRGGSSEWRVDSSMTTGGRRRARGRRRASRGMAGRVACWKDDSVSVASTTSKRGVGRPPRQPTTTAAGGRPPKRPWEGSEDEEDELSKRYGFGRSFLFSEEEEDDEEEEESDEDMASDQTDSDTGDDGGDSKKLHAAVPPSSSPSPFAHFGSQLANDDDDLEEEDFLAQLSANQIPPLVLGDSSVDLLIYKEHLMDTLEVYEVLLNYGSVLQLSPFLFEDFCAAIRSPKQSHLLCEIHLAFLRLFFREEDSEHTIFAATETTVSVNILLHMMDSLTFAEVLRHYVESDPHFPADVLHILQCSNYPFVELDKRLRVLKWMCERFFQFDMVKRIVGGTHKTKHDEQCRSCGKMGGGFGQLLACAECEAVYHLHCDMDLVPGPTPPPPPPPCSTVVDVKQPPQTNANGGGGGAVAEPAATSAAVPSSPADDPNWRCPLCRIYVAGITDENCLLPGQITHRNLSRITSIGKDRHGRLYWFMVRRIFVQDPLSGELYYYSTLPQLFDLINHLDPVRFERRLCRRLGDLLPSVAMQMHATLELTDQRWRQRCASAKVPERCPARPYLHSDNVHRMSRILGTVLMEKEEEEEENNNNQLLCIDQQQQQYHNQQEQPQQQQQLGVGDDGGTSGTEMTTINTTTTLDENADEQQQQVMETDNNHNTGSNNHDVAGGCGDDAETAADAASAAAVQNGDDHGVDNNKNNNDDNGDDDEEEEEDDVKKIDVTTSTNDGCCLTTTARNNNNELLQMVKTLLCIKDGHLVATFWSAGMSEIQLLDYCSYFVDIKAPPEELLAQEGVPPPGARTADDFFWWRSVPQEFDLLEELNRRLNRGFRLGFSDGAYLQYVNHFSANPDLCRSAAVRKAERDKRKYMSSRFSISDQGEFTWLVPKGRVDHYGTVEDMLRCVQLNLRRLVDRIPDALMHRRWVLDGEKGNFLRRLATVADIDALRDLLMLYEAAIRRPVFLPIWWQSLAATRFIRITSECRERRLLLDNARKKEEKALQQAAESDAASAAAAGIVLVRYTLFGGMPPRHQLWRTMKDEQYRLNGLGALGGWQWISSTLVRRFTSLPEKPRLNASTAFVLPSLATRRACRFERIGQRLLDWRLHEEQQQQQDVVAVAPQRPDGAPCPTISSSSTTSSPAVPCCCYSTSCRMLTSATTCSPAEVAWPCYSPSCTRRTWTTNSHRTRGVVKAKPFTSNGEPNKQTMAPSATDGGALGQQKPFPFPQPHDFKSGTGKRSILKLPKWFLKRLARQGGTNPNCSLHFFHQTAKSNPTVWPYPCVRPLFFYCWRYLTSGAQSIHALALRFRLLYACIRWADMSPDPDDEDPRVWSHQTDYDEVRMVVSHKENPPDGYYEQYLLKVDQYLVEDGAEDERDALFGADDDDSATYRQSSVRETDYAGSTAGTGRGAGRRGAVGRRRRQRGGGGGIVADYRGVVSDEYGRAATARQQRQQRGSVAQQWRSPPRRVRTLTRWIDGVDLKLYEISWYWTDWLRNTMADAARAREEQRRRKALEAAAAASAAQQQQHQPVLYHHLPVQQQQQQYHHLQPLQYQHHHQQQQQQQYHHLQPLQYHHNQPVPTVQQQLQYQQYQQPQQQQQQQLFAGEEQPQQPLRAYKIYYVNR